MTERILTCPNCKSIRVKIVSASNVDSYELNIDALLSCEECEHYWNGKITNNKIVYKRRIW